MGDTEQQKTNSPLLPVSITVKRCAINSCKGPATKMNARYCPTHASEYYLRNCSVCCEPTSRFDHKGCRSLEGPPYKPIYPYYCAWCRKGADSTVKLEYGRAPSIPYHSLFMGQKVLLCSEICCLEFFEEKDYNVKVNRYRSAWLVAMCDTNWNALVCCQSDRSAYGQNNSSVYDALVAKATKDLATASIAFDQMIKVPTATAAATK